jgi:hypothetical protein
MKKKRRYKITILGDKHPAFPGCQRSNVPVRRAVSKENCTGPIPAWDQVEKGGMWTWDFMANATVCG